MAAEEDFEGDEPEFDAGAGGGGGGGKKKLLLLIVVPLVLVLGGAAAAYFTGLADPLLAMFHKEAPAEGAPAAEAGHEGAPAKAAEGEHGAAPAGTAVPYELPEMLVNINTPGRAKSFLKIKVSLELSNADDINRIENVKPRIIDSFQVYLRELRLEDLQGAAGVYRMREELLMRVNAAARPAVVKDVLFQEMIVQ